MTDDDPRFNSPLDTNVRTAYQALRALVPEDYALGADDAPLLALIAELPDGAPSRAGPVHRGTWRTRVLERSVADGGLDTP